MLFVFVCCFQCFKDTKMRANHNTWKNVCCMISVVSNVSKILKWEQITTSREQAYQCIGCFQCFKDTKMRANHNNLGCSLFCDLVVSNVSKILKWEQITTPTFSPGISSGCFQCFKDTKMRANHNGFLEFLIRQGVVSNVSKILKWEQITTLWQCVL